MKRYKYSEEENRYICGIDSSNYPIKRDFIEDTILGIEVILNTSIDSDEQCNDLNREYKDYLLYLEIINSYVKIEK